MTPDERIKELEDALVVVQQKFSPLMAENATLKSKVLTLTAELSAEKHRVKALRDGLTVYLPGPFWDTVVQDTKADMDQGKHAEYVLRVTGSTDDPEAA